MSQPKLVCVIPAHNEASRLAGSLQDFVKNSPVQINQIVICENGSRDSTLEAAENIRSLFPHLITVLSCPEADFGKALLLGYKWVLEQPKLQDHWVQFNGADIPFGVSDLKEFVGALKDHPKSELFIGSKFHPQSQVSRSLKRTLASQMFRLLRWLLLGLRVRDTQGTLLFKVSHLKEMLPVIRAEGFFVTTEIVYWFYRKNLEITELPVILRQDMRPSSVSVLRQSVRMLKELIRLRIGK